MITVYISAFIFVSYLSIIHAATTSLVLNPSNNVVAGSTATYNCSSQGTGADPTIVWSIRATDGTVVRSNSQLSSSIVDGTTNTNDGSVKSSVTFTVQSSYLTNHRLWCGAIDSGATSPSIQIYTAIAATTTTTANLGGTCGGSVTCSTAFSSCTSSVCRCNQGYYDTNGESNPGGSCSQQASLGGTCQAGNDFSCSVSNSRCSSTSPYVCVCNTGYTQSGTTCTADAVALGEQCVSPVRTCYVSNSYCNGYICVCSSGYYRSGTVCLVTPASIGGSCTNPSRTCPSNAGCYNGFCSCNSGYIYSNSLGYCISSSAGIGESCTSPSRSCPTNAGCTNGFCQCSSGFTYSTSLGYCVSSSAGISESCVNPTRTCPAFASCVNTVCQCNSGYIYSSSLGYCVLTTASIGESCINPTRSCPSNAACNNGVCQCNSGFSYSNSLGYCISSSAGVGESCTNPTRTCPAQAVCSNGICQCNSGYIYSSTLGYCVSSTANVGESCVNPSRSCVSNAACSSSVCQCVTNYYALSGNCFQKAGLDETCSTSVSDSCSDSYASCSTTSGRCQCDSGYTNTNGVCTSTSTYCPAGSNVAVTATGSTTPSTPSVTVGQSCYQMNLYATQVLACRDSKGSSALQSARWLVAPNYDPVQQSTGSFINGDIANPNLTISNAQSSYARDYICQLCYGSGYTQCTNSTRVTVVINGTALTSVSASASNLTPIRGNQVSFTCAIQPIGGASNIQWFRNNNVIRTIQNFTIATIGSSQAGDYKCQASNSFGSMTSNTFTLDVQYPPEIFGGTTVTYEVNLETADEVITCNMNANPAILYYVFYNAAGVLLQNGTSNTYTVSSASGYQTYSCRARSSLGLSSQQFHDVIEESINVGAATENTGIGTGTIVAIVLGIIFLILLIIIIIVCCCSYGWCRKKERVEPQVIVEKPVVKPYIPRTIVSASSTISRKDVGVMVNGHHNVAVAADFEEPRYTTPRYHLKPAYNEGPIISMFDDGYEQPRAHQLPALDTQYLYPDDAPKKHKKRKHKRRHREDVSPRRQYYEPEPEPEVRYAETQPASDEDLVVVPGKQNYFE